MSDCILCGRISLPTKWFDDDTEDEIEEFNFYYNKKLNKVYSTKEWRNYWIKCIKPTFSTEDWRIFWNRNIPRYNSYDTTIKYPYSSIVTKYEFVANPRQIHPYATIVRNFADNVNDFILSMNNVTTPPYFVLPQIILPSILLSDDRDDDEFPEEYETPKEYEIPEEYKYLLDINRYCMHDFATKIQLCYRRFLAVRVIESIRIDPDSLFTADKSIIDIRLRKCGIDPATYHKMSAGRDI